MVTTVRRRILLWVFYGGLALLLVSILSGALSLLLPSGLAARIAQNSEGYLFALVLGAWIQLVLPRIREERRSAWAVVHGLVWALIGIGLVVSDLPSSIRTLNESALGLAIALPYVTLRRPLRPAVPYLSLVLVALTAWAVVWAPESWVIDQAETFGLVVLLMLTVDVFDRPLLDPAARARGGVRWAWYAFMTLEPVVVSAIGTDARSDGTPLALTLEYLGRIHESFIGVLLVALILHLVRAQKPAP